MKVRVVLTVEVDAEAWAYEYGLTKSQVAEDVRQYIFEHAQYGDLIDDVKLMK